MYFICQKCKKRLTDPESMARGYGPECWAGIVGAVAIQISRMEEEQIPGQMDIFDFQNVIEKKQGDVI